MLVVVVYGEGYISIVCGTFRICRRRGRCALVVVYTNDKVACP